MGQETRSASASESGMPDTDLILVLSTCPDVDTAQAIAEQLVAERLAACVNILPELRSLYRWQGAVETASEHLLLIKTSRTLYPRLEQRINELHPYDVPEVIAVPVDLGLPAYLTWVRESLQSGS